MTRHFYKHLITGLVAPLNDSFAEVFADRFERVEAPAKDDTVVGDFTPPVDDKNGTDAVPADAVAPTDADANPANTGVNP